MPSTFRRTLGSLLTVVLAASAVFIGIAPASAAGGTDYIDWGVKESFRGYITGGIANGTITLTEGVTTNTNGSYRWPATSSSYDPATGDVVVEAAGAVAFWGHHGSLDLTISDVSLRITPAGDSAVSARVVSTTTSGTVVDYGVVAMATVNDAKGTRLALEDELEWTGLPTVLTDVAAPSFGGFYAAGQALDPVGFHVSGDWPAESEVESWDAPGAAVPVHTDTVETGVLPALTVADTTRGTVTVLADGLAASVNTVCRAHNVGVYAECLTATTRIQHPDQGQITATVFEAATGSVLRTFDITTQRVSVAIGFNGASAVLDQASGDIVLRLSNYGVIVIPAGATSIADVATLTPMNGTTPDLSSSMNFVAIDQGSQRLFLADDASGLYSFTRVNGAWTQESLFGGLLTPGAIPGSTVAPAYMTVEQTTGDVYFYDVGKASAEGTPATRAVRDLIRVSGFREGNPVIDSQRIDLSTTTTDSSYYGGLVSDPETGTLFAVVSQLSPLFFELVAVKDGEVIARQALPGPTSSLTIDDSGRLYSLDRSSKLVTVLNGRDLAAGSIPELFETTVTDGAGYPVSAGGLNGRTFIPVYGPTPTAITVANAMTLDQYRTQRLYSSVQVYDWFSTPTVTTQPVSTAVELTGAEYLSDGSIGEPDAKVVTLEAAATGTPAPGIQWQARTAYGWEDIAGETGTTLSVTVRSQDDGDEYRAVFRNFVEDASGTQKEVGSIATQVAMLNVTVAQPEVVEGPEAPKATLNADGSISGAANAAGASITVKPGTELAADGGALTISGAGFTKASNTHGVYALFGYATSFPSTGSTTGSGYDYIVGAGTSGQEGQLFISWPENTTTGGAANGFFGTDGTFSATGLTATSTFTGASGSAVNCLDGSVQCGVLTIGAHGGRDAALETFTPVFFVGQEVDLDAPVLPTPPVAPPAVVVPAAEGSLTWGVKASFRSYIAGPIAKGAVTVSNGASSNGAGYRFGQTAGGSFDASTGVGTSNYRGSVHFTGHNGLLDLTIANPVIRIDSATSGALLVSVNGSGPVAFGTVNLGAAIKSPVTGGVSYSGAPVSLTAAGSAVFAYGGSQFYSAGQAMDAVSFVIGSVSTASVAASTVAAFADTTWTPPATPPATQGITGETDGLVEGGEFTGTASGFAPNETDIKVVIYSSPVVLALDLTADADGVATWTGFLPDGLTGEHTLTFQGSVNRGIVLQIGASTDAAAGCLVDGATIDWGFKESFRSYISGSIANGEWTVADGATYETPTFGFVDGSGTYSSGAGVITFTGSITFTGHDGVLNTTVENPQLRMIDDTHAQLLLDVNGPTMEGDPIDETAVPFVDIDIDLAGAVVADDGSLTVIDAPTEITAQGYAAFPNYQPGTAFDPISFTIPAAADCADPAAVVSPEAAAVSSASADFGWVLWVAIGVLLLIVIALVIVLLRRGRAQS